MEDQIIAKKLRVFGNQGVDTDQLTAYLGQAHGVLLGLGLACETKEQPKPHAFSTPEPAMPTKNQALRTFPNPPEVQ
jgi:hypothetical protein